MLLMGSVFSLKVGARSRSSELTYLKDPSVVVVSQVSVCTTFTRESNNDPGVDVINKYSTASHVTTFNQSDHYFNVAMLLLN